VIVKYRSGKTQDPISKMLMKIDPVPGQVLKNAGNAVARDDPDIR